jgi:enamine deaminase RidA (YjgF/YER057c/UK114 family)
MSFRFINPESLGAPSGFSNGVLAAEGGALLFIAGQIAWDERQRIVSADFVEQFDRALANLLTVVSEAGGKPEHVARLVIYVTDKSEYLSRTREVGARYRARMGRHFPAMVLVEVKSLLEDAARVEIEGIAVIRKQEPGARRQEPEEEGEARDSS